MLLMLLVLMSLSAGCSSTYDTAHEDGRKQSKRRYAEGTNEEYDRGYRHGWQTGVKERTHPDVPYWNSDD